MVFDPKNEQDLSNIDHLLLHIRDLEAERERDIHKFLDAAKAECVELRRDCEVTAGALADTAEEFLKVRTLLNVLRVYANHLVSCPGGGGIGLCTCGYTLISAKVREALQQ